MKILLINNIHYRRGGADVVYLNTAELLKRAGHKVIYFSRTNSNNIECKDAQYFAEGKEHKSKMVTICRYFYNRDAARKLEILLQKEKPDIAHVHLLWGGLSPSIFKVLRKYNVPLVHTVHDYRLICPSYTLNCNGEICERCKGKNFYNCAIKRCSKGKPIESFFMMAEMYFRNLFFYPSKHFDGLIYVSKFSKHKHFQYMPSLDKVATIVLYNFTTPPKVEISSNMKQDYFLFFGRLSYEKGVDKLIEVFKSFPELRLKIVGTGPLDSLLRQKVEDDELENVDFLGYKTGPELQSIIAKAKIVLVPSIWYENNPMTIIEAYSMKTPVIGANIGGIPEIVEEGRTGYLYNPDDMDMLCSRISEVSRLSTSDYNEMMNNCYNFFISHFTEKQYLRYLLDFYESIVRKKKTNNPTEI